MSRSRVTGYAVVIAVAIAACGNEGCGGQEVCPGDSLRLAAGGAGGAAGSAGVGGASGGGGDAECLPGPVECSAMDIRFVTDEPALCPNVCAAPLGKDTCPPPWKRLFTFDGQRCVGIIESCGAHCEGKDCDKLFATRGACEAAYATCIEPCKAVDDAREIVRELPCPQNEREWSQTRFRWNGASCERIFENICGDHSCEGADCNNLYGTLDECTSAHAQCEPAGCRSMDVKVVSSNEEFACAARVCTPEQGCPPGFLGSNYAFKDGACPPFSLCCQQTCEGKDCDKLFKSRRQCEQAYAACFDCRAPDAVKASGPMSCTSDDQQTLRYYSWNGASCSLVPLRQPDCTCQGVDCARLYPSLDDCLGAHNTCVVEVK